MKAKRKQRFQDMYSSNKRQISSSDKSVLFSGDSSSDKMVAQEKETEKDDEIIDDDNDESKDNDDKGEEEKKQEQTTHTTATSTPVEEISAIHHILPSARDRKTDYSLHQYYRSEHKPGYKKINTFLLLQYKEEVLKFLQNLNSNANLKDVVYKYKDIVKHIENNTP